MALIEIENQESAEYFRGIYGIKECPHTYNAHQFDKNFIRVRFLYNSENESKSICMGDPCSLPICRKCNLYNKTEDSLDH